jgi:hypothetical protein
MTAEDSGGVPAVDRDVCTVLEAVPEFVDRYLELVEAADGDPGAPVTFTELADYVVDLVAEIENHRPSLVRCLDAVEKVAADSPDAEELVVWSFFDVLSPDDLVRLEPWLGPRTRGLLEDAERAPSASPDRR